MAGRATADDRGEYDLDGEGLRVDPFEGAPQASTPYARYPVVGTAFGYGVAGGKQDSSYAVPEPDLGDIQRRHRLGEAVTWDLVFRPSAGLRGRVLDEHGEGVEHVNVEVHDDDPLDEHGLETHAIINGDWWEIVPGGVGIAETDPEGRFRLPGLQADVCFWVWLRRPGPGHPVLDLYASTTPGPDTVHEGRGVGLSSDRGGRQRHAVAAGDLKFTYPTTRRFGVRVAYEDTGELAPGLPVNS